jgi:fatty-acyl-CoA synthase
VASVGWVKSTLLDRSDEELADVRAASGLPILGVDGAHHRTRLEDPLPWDGEQSGELQCRGPWIARTYYNDPRAGESFTGDGWLRTGDVATIDPEGYIRLVDRTKDLIKSGGEWISSVELENELMGHPKIAEAAVIGVKSEKWSERPLACVVLKPDEELTAEEVLDYLRPKVARWQVPDEVVFIDEVPKTSVGQVLEEDAAGALRRQGRAVARSATGRDSRPRAPCRRGRGRRVTTRRPGAGSRDVGARRHQAIAHVLQGRPRVDGQREVVDGAAAALGGADRR